MAWGWLSTLLTPPTLSVCFSTPPPPTPDDLGAGITGQRLKFGHMAAPSQWSSGLWPLSFTCTAQCWEDRAPVMRDILLKQDFPPHIRL